MAFAKGPQEGFHAARDGALEINPRLKCRRCVVPGLGSFHRVYDGERKIGEGRLARDAWSDALDRIQSA
jgi:hypothetical protein